MSEMSFDGDGDMSRQVENMSRQDEDMSRQADDMSRQDDNMSRHVIVTSCDCDVSSVMSMTVDDDDRMTDYEGQHRL